MRDKDTRHLVDDFPVGLYYTDARGDRSYVNQHWGEITGLGAGQASNESWQQALHPEDRSRVQQEWQKAFDQREPYQSEHRYVHSDGRLVWALAQAFPAAGYGEGHKGYIGTVVDITERKEQELALRRSHTNLEKRVGEKELELESINAALRKQILVERQLAGALSDSEAKWRSIVENAPDFIMTVDRTGTISFINHTVDELSVEEVIGTRIYNYAPKRYHAVIRNALGESFRTGKPTDYRIKTQITDKPAWYSSRVSPIIQDGSVQALTIIATDITERHLLEKKMQQHQRELTQYSQLHSMAELASSLAHELNQPLGAINNYAKGCLRRLQNGVLEKDEFIMVQERIAAQAERAGGIMLRIRNLVSKGELKRVPAGINTIIIEAISYMDPATMDSSVTIDLQLKNDLPEILVDKLQIEQVIINLVQNGIESMKASRHSDNRLTIESLATKEGGVSVSISDQGAGLQEGMLEEIFNPFFSTKPNGTGIGLCICRSIIETHGGHMAAENNADRGATFSFKLPAKGA